MTKGIRRRLWVLGPPREDAVDGPLMINRGNALIAANMLRSAFVWDNTAASPRSQTGS